MMRLNIASRDSCAKTFSGTRWQGLFLLLGIVGSIYLHQVPNRSLEQSRKNDEK